MLTMAAYCYLSDITEPEKRTKRTAIIGGVGFMGYNIGTAVAGPIKVKLGYQYNFSLGLLFSLLSVAWCVFFVKESEEKRDLRLAKELGQDEECNDGKRISEFKRQSSIKAEKEKQLAEEEAKGGVKSSCYGLFRISSLTEGFRTVLKKREGNERMFVILTITAIVLDSFADQGKWAVAQLYFARVLGWNEIQFGIFSLECGLIGAVGNFLIVPILTRRIKLHDATISIIDCITFMIGYNTHKHKVFINYVMIR